MAENILWGLHNGCEFMVRSNGREQREEALIGRHGGGWDLTVGDATVLTAQLMEGSTPPPVNYPRYNSTMSISCGILVPTGISHEPVIAGCLSTRC